MKTPRGTKFKEYDLKTADMSMSQYVRETAEDQLDIAKKLYDRKMSLMDDPIVQSWIADIERTIADDVMWFMSVDERYDENLKEVIMILRASIIVDTSEQAEEVRGRVQLALHQAAKREVNDITGKIFYVFSKDLEYNDPTAVHEMWKIKHGSMRVTIDNASLAPKCEVIEKTEIVTRFVIKCEDDES